MHSNMILSHLMMRRQSARKPSAFQSFPTAPVSERASNQMWLAGGIVLGVTLGGIAWSWFSLAPPQECRMARMMLRLDTANETSLHAASGVPCTMAVEPGSATVEALTVEKSPNYGGLVPRGRTGVIYRSMPGFKGDDDFVVALKGRLASHEGEMRIRAKVVVR
jgi:hypothetical protein